MERDQPLSPNLDEHEAEGEGYGTEDGPESQGRYAGEGFGRDDYDSSDTRPPDDREPRMDDLLEEEVRDRLVEELGVDPVDVAVSVTGGIVMLDGLVDELEARDALEQVALDVPGIVAVENRLRQRRGPGEES